MTLIYIRHAYSQAIESVRPSDVLFKFHPISLLEEFLLRFKAILIPSFSLKKKRGEGTARLVHGF